MNEQIMDPDAALSPLEWQNAVLRAVFLESGFKAVDPPILQPAEVFFNLSGEDIRSRIYVMTDPGGEELCLRPDLTIPTCRAYLQRDRKASYGAKLFYDGLAFRYQPEGIKKATEFRQVGVEFFGGRDRQSADADVLGLMVEGCTRAGLSAYQIKIGDVGLFFSLIDALYIPEQWRIRLRRAIWHGDEFNTLLKRYAKKPQGKGGTKESGGLLGALSQLSEDEAKVTLADVLDLAQIAPVGGRSVDEITERLLHQAAEMGAEGLSPETVKLINDYLKVKGKPYAAMEKISRLTKRAGVDLGKALGNYEKRLKLIEGKGIDLANVTFDANFGRTMEYYTGFVFEVHGTGNKDNEPVAGGGRYDTLLRALGAARDVPAVGGMIRSERLLAAVGGHKS